MELPARKTTISPERSSDSKLNPSDLLKELQKITNDEQILNFIASQTDLKLSRNE